MGREKGEDSSFIKELLRRIDHWGRRAKEWREGNALRTSAQGELLNVRVWAKKGWQPNMTISGAKGGSWRRGENVFIGAKRMGKEKRG